MRLAEFSLFNFRNIKSTEIEPDPYFNILQGDNAQGKTNLLESICLLGSLKSFRNARNEELIQHGEKQASIKGKVVQQSVRNDIRVDITAEGKQARLNGKTVSQPEDYLKCLRPIVFAPEEINLVKGAPGGRRRLVDRAVFQTERGYLQHIQKYDRQLKQRNSLLKQGKSAAEIEPWSIALAGTGARIRKARSDYLRRLVPVMNECYRQICQEKEQIDLLYKEEETDLQIQQEKLATDFERQQEQERRYGMTLSGPHRDDYDFLIDGRPIKSYGSQGQQRSFILAFKAAQTIDIKNVYGEPPLLLLDDLTGELDRQRQNLFCDFLIEMQAQVFITTTDIQPLRTGGISSGRFFRVDRGEFHADSH